MSADGSQIVAEPKLTNLNMAWNPKRTHLIDFDSDGDLDLYINDNNQDCGPMCLMENIGDYEFEQNLEGIWGEADVVFWDEFGYLIPLQIKPRNDIERLFLVSTGEINISDIDGDGVWDFYALKTFQSWHNDVWDYDAILNIIYGE